VDVFTLGATFFTILFQSFPFNVSNDFHNIYKDPKYIALDDDVDPYKLHDCEFF
jgi:hypothetical protein